MTFGAALKSARPIRNAHPVVMMGSDFYATDDTVWGLQAQVETKEPKLVRKQSQEPSKSPRLRENTSRPWMLNRGC